jgi:Raf kinase inhibitor-like YbhB/YbcL family protein
LIKKGKFMKTTFTLLFLLFFQVSHAAPFKLKSSSIKPKIPVPMKHVFNSFGCTGENISPALNWSGAPKGTKSFAITVFDPDAPTGSGWWHWTLVNIPANVTKIEEGASNTKTLPKGAVEGRTDYGKSGYGGPCPPQKDKPHRYIFTIYALKTDKIDINEESSGAVVGYNVLANALDKASFTVKYGR